jgi:DNA-binding transcriptional MerR regulator
VNLYSDSFGIGELARRTGLTVSTLRAWEHRHGFPHPDRRESGHRRYTQRDVDAVRAVLEARASGKTLAAALAQASLAHQHVRSSVLATLRRELPDTATFVLSKLSMHAISRAIEDEALSRSAHPLLIGGFQHERFWRASEARWRHLAKGATATIALGAGVRRRQRDRLWEIPLTTDMPITLEWFVICDSPSFSACLAAVEIAAPRRRLTTTQYERSRRFDALWTINATAVRQAARTACAIATSATPALAEITDAHWRRAPVDDPRTVTQLTNRIIRRLDIAKWRN